MQTCPNCNHLNRPGVVFCDNCGASLLGEAPMSTKNFNSVRAPEGTADKLIGAVSNAGTDVFDKKAMLRLEILGMEPLVLKPQQETIFGRRDPATGAMPDVDLTPFAGYRMGVSRRHAAIRRSDDDRLDLWDLGSSNGTYLNGTRLLAHRPHRLHDGDEIRFGQMVMKIFFQQMTENAPSVSAGNTGTNGTAAKSGPTVPVVNSNNPSNN